MEILKVQSTEDKLNYLLQTKAAIKQAIIDQGGTITENTTFREFVEQIQELNVIEPEVIEEIKQALRELAEIEEEQNEQIQTIVAALNTKLEEADVADLRTQADSNTTRITTAEEEVTSLKGRATSLEERTTNLETNKANQSDLDSTNTRVQLAEAAIQANTGDINAVKTRVQTAEENISTNTTNIAKNTSDISNINENIEEIQTTVESNTNAIVANKEEFDQAVIDLNEEISKRLTTEAAKPLIKKVEYNATTATFTFEDMEGNTKTVDLPLEATVKGGRYDAARKVLILILVSDDEIEIPVTDLVDVYTGLENAKIKVIVNNQNQIEAQLKSASVEKTDLATALVEELEAKATKAYVDGEFERIDSDVEQNTSDIETLGERVTTNETNIANNITEINGLKTRLTTAEGNITTNTTNIANNTQAISDLETVVDGKLTMKELGDDLLEAAKATSAGTLVPKIFADLQYSHQYRIMLPYITISNTGAVSYGFQDIISNSVNDASTNPVTLKFVKDENDDDIYILTDIDESKLTYDNTNSGLQSSTIQTAIDELADKVSHQSDIGVYSVNGVDPVDGNVTITGEDIKTDETGMTITKTIEDLDTNLGNLIDDVADNLELEIGNREEADQNLQNQIDNIHIPEYSVVESTTTQGYAKTYSLTKDGAETGAKINIPKDLVVKSGEVKVVTVADQPYEGAVVGDKYIDLEINDVTADHIYIPVKDLVDVYTGKNNSKIHTTINANNEIEAELQSGSISVNDFDTGTKHNTIRLIQLNSSGGSDPFIVYFTNFNGNTTVVRFSSDGDTKPTIDNSNKLIYNTNSEQVSFASEESGLQSTKLAPAIRELKGLIDDEEAARIATDEDIIASKVDVTEEANKIYGTDEEGTPAFYDKDDFGKVDTVNNIQPDSNKNITLDATQINVDETAATKVTIKSNLEDLATQIWNEHESQDQINQYVHEDIDNLGERISNLQDELYQKEDELEGSISELGSLLDTEQSERYNADQALQDQIDAITIPEYTIEEQAQAETGYSKTYYLTKDGTQIGSKINIPKDLVVESGEVKVVEEADVPYEGAVVGDKYIDITLNDQTEDHIYIPVKDLVDVYTGVDGNKVNVTINAQNQIEALIKTGTIEETDLTAALQTKIGNIATNTQNISGLDTRLTTAETDIDNLEAAIEEAGKVDTVNNVQPDANKNVQLDASNINLDDTVATPETLKSIIEAQATKITTLEGKVAELESALGDIRTALELLNGVEDANSEEF